MKRFTLIIALAALAVPPLSAQAPDVTAILKQLDDMGDFSGRDFCSLWRRRWARLILPW